jgi:hypothetical protein
VKADPDLDGEILVTTATNIGRIPIFPRRRYLTPRSWRGHFGILAVVGCGSATV